MTRARQSHFEVRVRVVSRDPRGSSWPEPQWFPVAEVAGFPFGDSSLRFELLHNGPMVRLPKDPPPPAEPVTANRPDLLSLLVPNPAERPAN